jgi:hypothetical protein
MENNLIEIVATLSIINALVILIATYFAGKYIVKIENLENAVENLKHQS